MDTTFSTLVCYLLTLLFAVAQTEDGTFTVTPVFNLTHTSTIETPANSTAHVTVISNLTENTTPFPSTTHNNEPLTEATAATTESTSHLQTSQSTATMTPITNHTSVTTATPGTSMPTFTALTTPTLQTTEGYISTPDTTVITTANSSHTDNTTSDSMHRTTQGFGLNNTEINMTILFSVVLGVFAMALVLLMFHKCKHRIQYLHQPLTNTEAMDAYVAGDDTLVISGGLYDGHPIYDNVPTASEEQSQFRLEFLH